MCRRALVLRIVLGLLALGAVAASTSSMADRFAARPAGIAALRPAHESGLSPVSSSERPDALTSTRRNDFGAAGRLRAVGALLALAVVACARGRRVSLRGTAFSRQVASRVARMRAPPVALIHTR